MTTRYSNGKIYSIRSYQTDAVYIGSTCLPLYKRLYKHRDNFNRWKDGKQSYTTSYEILKYDDAFIELIEDYPCERKEQLNRREGEIIRETENTVNKIIAGRTRKEYKHDNREIIKIKSAEYKEKNKEIIKIKDAEYREKNKDKERERKIKYRKENPEKERQYRADNAERLKEGKKKYYEENKDKEKARSNTHYQEKVKGVKIYCECGLYLNKSGLLRHTKRKKHKLWQDTYDYIYS